MSNRRTKLTEGTSPFSGTQALVAAQHTHGRRHAAKFAGEYQLTKVSEHIVDLSKQLSRAVRLGRTEKVALLADLITKAKRNGQVLGERIATSMMGPVERIGTARVLLDLSFQQLQHTAPVQQRFGKTIVNAGKAFILPV